MVYMENDACPEKNDFLWTAGRSQQSNHIKLRTNAFEIL